MGLIPSYTTLVRASLQLGISNCSWFLLVMLVKFTSMAVGKVLMVHPTLFEVEGDIVDVW